MEVDYCICGGIKEGMSLEIIGALLVKKGLETVSTELVKTLIETHIKPSMYRHAETKNEVEQYDRFQECLQEYLEIIYGKAMIMNTIVFKDLRVPKTLCDLYVPLTLQIGDKRAETSIGSSLDTHNIGYEEYIIDDEYEDCINKYDKILIMDTAGMGKSTLVKYFAVQEINNNRRIPIIIELRKLTDNVDIMTHICNQFVMNDKSLKEEELIKMLKMGEFIIFFDGYDEIPEDYRGNILDDLQEFIVKAANNKYIITSRNEDDLSCLGDFYGFSIKPLTMEEAFSLIRKYDSNGDVGELLIERICNDKNLDVLKEFLVNPLLVSLLYKTFDYKREIPYKKIKFYEQVYEALFNDHDKTKGSAYVHPKKCNLDIHDFERVLRRIGFFSLQNRMIEYRRSRLLEIIDSAIFNMPWISARSDEFLNDITHAVPLFQKDGNDYKWSHKSFMEYFAAEYICYESNKTYELFETMMNSENITTYENVLDFCWDIKPDIARKSILYLHIKKFVEFCEGKYADEYFRQYKEVIDFRKSEEFENEIKLFVYENRKIVMDVFRDKEKVKDIFMEFGDKINSLQLSSENFMIGHKYKNTVFVNRLLRQKGVDIFSEIPEEVNELKDIKRIVTKEKSGVYDLNDDIESDINSDNNFMFVTALIADIDNSDVYLDYQKCLELCKVIEQEMEKEDLMNIELI